MGKRKYEVDNDFFRELNIKSAYILGLISADGNVAQDNTRMTLSICEKDAYILYEISKCLKSTYPIKTYVAKKKYKQYIFRISSKEMCKTLQKYGIVPAKSLKLTFPSLNKELISHYIRGYFDGDGCVNVTKMNNIGITIIGTKPFLEKLKQLYNETFNNNRGWIARHNKTNIFRFCLGGNISTRLFLDWIYEGSENSLKFERKYKIYKNHFSQNKF